MKKHALSSAAVLVVLAGSTRALGAFPAVFELSSLDGTNDFVINGVDMDDFSRRSVSAVDDVNGDGVDDIIIGAKRAAPNGLRSGESYVVFGVGPTNPVDLSGDGNV